MINHAAGFFCYRNPLVSFQIPTCIEIVSAARIWEASQTTDMMKMPKSDARGATIQFRTERVGREC